MNSDTSAPSSKPTPALIAEAAAWIAILHGPNRTATAEQGFAKWLQTSPAHARAFEEATDIWEESRNIPRPAGQWVARPRMTNIVRPLTALAAGMLLAIVGVLIYLHLAGVATDVGEQRALTLEDGTRVLLNTATRVVVSYDKRRRGVEVKSGEALFEVAKRPDWPFVVTVGDRQVTALGTTFAVRRDERAVTVTLVEGKVLVTPLSSSGEVRLEAGQRVTFAAGRPASVDEPELQKTLAWQRREVAFDDMPLPEAIAEMNRYNAVPIVIEQSSTLAMPVSGLFRAGDSLSFARAVAAAYHLEVHDESNRIVLHDAAQ